MLTMPTRDRLAVPLDVDDPDQALELARNLAPYVGVFKVSPAHVYARGETFIAAVKKLGRKVFLDLKLYDIPKTVGRLCRQVARMGVDYVTVHAAGGSKMLERAREAAGEIAGSELKILAVTVLTSFDQEQLEREWKLSEPLTERVLFWAELAQKAGAAGIVCSPLELKAIRSHLGNGLFTVVPGIRSATDAKGDQRRTLTAREAIAQGADLIVVGRPILKHPDPAAAAQCTVQEIEAACPPSPFPIEP